MYVYILFAIENGQQCYMFVALLNKMLLVNLGVGKMFYSSTMLEFDYDDGIRF